MVTAKAQESKEKHMVEITADNTCHWPKLVTSPEVEQYIPPVVGVEGASLLNNHPAFTMSSATLLFWIIILTMAI